MPEKCLAMVGKLKDRRCSKKAKDGDYCIIHAKMAQKEAGAPAPIPEANEPPMHAHASEKPKTRCTRLTQKGTQCTKMAGAGKDVCATHEKMVVKAKCQGVTKKGLACKKLAVDGSTLCAVHAKEVEVVPPAPEVVQFWTNEEDYTLNAGITEVELVPLHELDESKCSLDLSETDTVLEFHLLKSEYILDVGRDEAGHLRFILTSEEDANKTEFPARMIRHAFARIYKCFGMTFSDCPLEFDGANIKELEPPACEAESTPKISSVNFSENSARTSSPEMDLGPEPDLQTQLDDELSRYFP